VRARNASWLRPWEATDPSNSGLTQGFRAMRAWARREGRAGRVWLFAITYQGRFVGQLTVGGIGWGSMRSANIGYWVDQQVAGRGITPTAVALAVDHCFRAAALHRVEVCIRPENTASRRVVEKLGFREEGLRPRFLHIDGAWRDHLAYALTVEEVPGGLMRRWREVRASAH